MFTEMTARELAGRLLAMPDPDSVVSLRVETWHGRIKIDEIMHIDVQQGLGADSPVSAVGWVNIVGRIEPF